MTDSPLPLHVRLLRYFFDDSTWVRLPKDFAQELMDALTRPVNEDVVEGVAEAIWLVDKPHGDWQALKSWAFGNPDDAQPGTIGARAHPDNWTCSKEDYDKPMVMARAALSASPPERWEPSLREVHRLIHVAVHEPGLRLGSLAQDFSRAFGVSAEFFQNLETAWLRSVE